MRSVDTTRSRVRLLARDDAAQATPPRPLSPVAHGSHHLVLAETTWVLGSVHDRSPNGSRPRSSGSSIINNSHFRIPKSSGAALDHFRRRPSRALRLPDPGSIEESRPHPARNVRP
jgi:hypothetical protein